MNNDVLLVLEQFKLVLFLVMVCAITSMIAFFSRFFNLEKPKIVVELSFWQVLLGFVIYFLTGTVLGFVFLPFFKFFNPQTFGDTLYLLSNICIVLLFLLFFYKLGPQKTHQILGDGAKSTSFIFGVISWFVAFPLSALIGLIIQIFVHMITDYNLHEQLAVLHLKNLMDFPLLFILTSLSFAIIIPFLEELIFRGFLLNYLKKFVNRHLAILFSAAIFALFHFSTKQSYDNIELIVSLFVLGWFLGFLYEKKRSIFAPFGLHVAFNAISIIRIISS
ncbi:MAG: hypothetical protein K940chlam8_00112 [Chlamydiae bacterium]|nr:hypothetical protein [Chlamydiota bacterium]